MRDPDKFLSPEPFWFGDLNVYNDIHNERIRAHRKHDSNGGSMERKEFTDSAWLSVLVEEVGEVARELCDYRHSIDRSGFKRRLRDELIQVAAMAWAWICAIDSDQPEPTPGAVAGEPESTPAAEPPIRSYPEFLRRFLPEEAERRRRAGMTPSEVAEEIGREAAAEALAAFTRAADTQEAP